MDPMALGPAGMLWSVCLWGHPAPWSLRKRHFGASWEVWWEETGLGWVQAGLLAVRMATSLGIPWTRDPGSSKGFWQTSHG